MVSLATLTGQVASASIKVMVRIEAYVNVLRTLAFCLAPCRFLCENDIAGRYKNLPIRTNFSKRHDEAQPKELRWL